MLRRVWLTIALVISAAPALAVMNSWLPSGQRAITGVTLSKSYFTGTQTPGTTIGAVAVTTTGTAAGMSFSGTITLGGADAAKFAISGNNLNAAVTLSPGIDYNLTITPVLAGWANSGVPVPIFVYGGLTYYMSPTGNDSNNGTSSSTPWATVTHNIHCADTIIAAGGEYAAISFGWGFWGTVSCPGNDNVAWIKCVTAFACDVNGEYQGRGAIAIDASYWGVQGFTATDSSGVFGECFAAQPRNQFQTIHHIVYANDVANTCPLSGFDTSDWGGATGPAAVDYFMLVGNLVWNGAISSAFCGSGMGTASPAPADNAPGPHMLWTLNISTNTINGNNCAGGGASGGSTDGQGYMIDRPDIFHYTPIIVLENNLAIANGAPGFHIFNGATTGIPQNVIVRNNTFYGDLADPNNCPFTSGEMAVDNNGQATITNNIAVATAYTKCGGTTVGLYTISTIGVTPVTVVDHNWLWNSANSSFIAINWSSGYSCLSGAGVPSPGTGNQGHAYCPGNTVADPLMTGPTSAIGQWFCSGFSDTRACAATTIARFTPTASGASAFGFTAPTAADQYNSTPFFKNVFRALPTALNPHGF